MLAGISPNPIPLEHSRALRRVPAASHLVLALVLRDELLPVPRTLGLGVKMGLEVADGTTQFQPGVQARGGAVGAGAWGIGCASGARSGPASEHAAQLG